jgi:hypothetical protein
VRGIGNRCNTRRDVRDTRNRGRHVDSQVLRGRGRRSTNDTEGAAAQSTNEALRRGDNLRNQDLDLAEVAKVASTSTSLGVSQRGSGLGEDGLTHITNPRSSLGVASRSVGNSGNGSSLGRDHEAWGVVANVVGGSRNKLTGTSGDLGKSVTIIESETSWDLTKETSNGRHFLYSGLRKKTRRGG